jgi:hypothetical protein
MNLALLLNALGLGAGLIGSVLLFRFGLPPNVHSGGQSALLLEQDDPAEAAKAIRYDRLGRFGIGLVV